MVRVAKRAAIGKTGVIIAIVVIIIVAAIGLEMQTKAVAPNASDSTLTSSGVGTFKGSGPVSTFPAAWSPWSSCPGEPNSGNVTTVLNGLSTTTFPDSWNTTSIVTLGQVYQDIINSPAFMRTVSEHGWVVFSWNFIPNASTNLPPNTPDVVAYFILTNATSPSGYVSAFYDIQTGGVAMSSVDSFPYPYECTSTTSSSSSSPA